MQRRLARSMIIVVPPRTIARMISSILRRAGRTAPRPIGTIETMRGAVIPTSERDPRVEVVHLDETTHLKTPKAALEQLRDAVAAVQIADPGISLTLALQRGIELVVAELRERHHGGAPFPARTERYLRPGRRARRAPAAAATEAPASTEPGEATPTTTSEKGADLAAALEDAIRQALAAYPDERGQGRGER